MIYAVHGASRVTWKRASIEGQSYTCSDTLRSQNKCEVLTSCMQRKTPAMRNEYKTRSSIPDEYDVVPPLKFLGGTLTFKQALVLAKVKSRRVG